MFFQKGILKKKKNIYIYIYKDKEKVLFLSYFFHHNHSIKLKIRMPNYLECKENNHNPIYYSWEFDLKFHYAIYKYPSMSLLQYIEFDSIINILL